MANREDRQDREATGLVFVRFVPRVTNSSDNRVTGWLRPEVKPAK